MKPFKHSHLSFTIGTCVSCCILAFLLTYNAGQRGFFAFDQSIVFDGGYRIVSGQVPYRDFVFPFGPVTFWLQAAFFAILGVSFKAYLICAASIAGVATAIAIVIVRLVLGGDSFAEIVAGILTAIWFYAPFGTPWVDQTAFFFAMIAILALVSSLLVQGSRLRMLLIFGGGIAWLACFLSKQNVGAFIGPLFPLALLVLQNRKGLLGLRLFEAFTLGILFGAFCFGLWLYFRSNPGAYAEYFFRLPSKLGSQRLRSLLDTGFGFIRPYFDGRGPWIVNAMMIASVVVGAAGLLWSFKLKTHRLRLASVLCIYLPCFQHIFINTTLNQAANGFGFAGLSFGLTYGVAMGLLVDGRNAATRQGGSGKRVLVKLLVVTAVVWASISGIRVSLDRSVHDIFEKPRFTGPLEIDNLRPLRWAHPTAMGGYEITEESIVQLYRYLKRSDCNFFIFPDFTIFYGLLGKPSPQPVLWFHRDVTYRGGANASLDSAIVRSLEQNNVQLLILEQVSWFNTGERLNDFPLMKAYLMANFARAGRLGSFLIYRRSEAHR